MYNIIDLHLHSNFSWDAQQTVEEIVEKSKKNNVTIVGLTEHFDFHYNHQKSYMYLDYEGYTAKIEAMRNDFPGLLKGLEVGEPYLYPDKFEKYIEGKEFDFFMGSVHWIGAISPVEERYFQNYPSVEEAYKVYLEEEFKLVSYGHIDVAPHVTLVNRRGAEFFPEFSYTKFKKEIDDILKAMIKNKIALEVNCSGLRMEAGDFIPDKETIKAYIGLGGDMLTAGSDAHRIKDTFFGLDRAYELLDSLGVKELTYFVKRKPMKIALKA